MTYREQAIREFWILQRVGSWSNDPMPSRGVLTANTSRRARADAAVMAEVHAAHSASRGTDGAPRVHAELAAKGIRVGRKRVARLMSRAELAGVGRRRFVTTTVRSGGRQAPDLVERNFTAQAPDRLWVADISVPQQAA